MLSVLSLTASLLWSVTSSKTASKEGPLYDTIIAQKTIPPYSICMYDNMFHEYADTLGWDWKWLAAVAYIESRFNADAENPSGAFGLMQLMPKTAEAMGIDSLHRYDPYMSVRAAARLFKRLDTRFESVPMPDRVCFVLASYNAGHGHILDAIRLAKKHGANAQRWYGNVEFFLQMKNDPAYYNDTVCHNGRFSGLETVTFVKNVQKKYDEYSQLEDLYFSIQEPDTILIPKK